jgi:hypothetical protein
VFALTLRHSAHIRLLQMRERERYIQQTPFPPPDPANRKGIPNIHCRIPLHKQQVRPQSCRNPPPILQPKLFRRHTSCRFQRLCRRQPRRHQHLHLVMHTCAMRQSTQMQLRRRYPRGYPRRLYTTRPRSRARKGSCRPGRY